MDGTERPADELPAADTPGEPETDLEAPPRAFLPTTPFGDAKPYAGSLADPPVVPRVPEAPAGEEETE